MSKVGLSDYSSYLHTYEAYRVNKKNISDDIPGAKNIKGEPGESVYVLTDKARESSKA